MVGTGKVINFAAVNKNIQQHQPYRSTDKRQYMTNNNIQLNGGYNGITWVLFDPCMKRTFKYQEREAEKYGFKRTDRANGIRIYAKFYGTREAALADKENIKAAVTALRTYNSGKVAEGIGTVICDKQYAQATWEEPYKGWSSEGSQAFVDIMR